MFKRIIMKTENLKRIIEHTSERLTLLHSNLNSFFNDFFIELKAGTLSCDVGPVTSESMLSNSISVHAGLH